MNTQAHHNSSDEIDLLELFKVLWDKKWWIVLSSFVCTAIAGVYAFTAKEQWTSRAEIISPTLSELGSYFTFRKEYARILGERVDSQALINELYGSFELLAYSLDTREDFFQQSEMYKALSQALDEKEKRVILSKLAREHIVITKPDPKKNPDAIGKKISVLAETPEMAQASLKQFVEYLNTLSFLKHKQEFLKLFKNKLADLKFEYEQIRQELEIRKLVQLQNLHKAAEIATKAGIKDYSKMLDNSGLSISGLAVSEAKISLSDSKLSDDIYLFMLGTKYLNAQIDTISQAAIVYPPKFYQIETQIQQLELLLEQLDTVEAKVYRYLSVPDYPVAKDKPKKALILVIGFAVGLILSMFWVLLFGLVRNKSSK